MYWKVISIFIYVYLYVNFYICRFFIDFYINVYVDFCTDFYIDVYTDFYIVVYRYCHGNDERYCLWNYYLIGKECNCIFEAIKVILNCHYRNLWNL